MRITFVTPCNDWHGGSRVIHIYASALQRRGHEVCVVTSPRAMSLRTRVRTLLATGEWKSGGDPEDGFYRDGPYTRLLTASDVPVSANDVPDSDVVIATYFTTAEWVAEYPASKGKKVHFVQGYELFPGVSVERLGAALRLPLAKITISSWVGRMIASVGADPGVCVPNAVDPVQFNAPPRRRRSPPTVGMIYSTHRAKDCETGLEAFALLRRKVPDAQFLTFGVKAPRWGMSLPSGAKFIRSPPQDRIAGLYASTDVWMCSSRSEGFGLPVLEAMACRCPVVSTEVGGPLDFLTDGREGFLVPIEDPVALADRLERVLRQPEDEWVRMSEAARRRATSYVWDDAVDRFEAVLKAIAQPTPELALAVAQV